MITDYIEKICRRCGKLTSEEKLKKHIRRTDGYDDICKVCYNNDDKHTPKGKVSKCLRNMKSRYKKAGISCPIDESKYILWATWFVDKFGDVGAKDLPEFIYTGSNTPFPDIFKANKTNLPSDISEEFVPSIVDSRAKVQKYTTKRSKRFFKKLVKIHGHECMISGCRAKALLQGAHIHEFRADSDDHKTNGLLLRIDLHKLYDMSLLGINPKNYAIVIADAVIQDDPEYAKYNGKILKFNPKCVPHAESLEDRWTQFNQNPGVKYLNKVLRKETPINSPVICI